MVAVKREHVDPITPPPSSNGLSSSPPNASITAPSSSPSKKAKVAKSSTPTKKESTAGSSSSPSQNGALTPDKREELIETVLAHGLKTISYPDLAARLGISVIQLRNATQAGKKGNLRYKAAKSVRGD